MLLDQAQAGRCVLEAALLDVLFRHLDERGDIGEVAASLVERFQLPVHAASVAPSVP